MFSKVKFVWGFSPTITVAIGVMVCIMVGTLWYADSHSAGKVAPPPDPPTFSVVPLSAGVAIKSFPMDAGLYWVTYTRNEDGRRREDSLRSALTQAPWCTKPRPGYPISTMD